MVLKRLLTLIILVPIGICIIAIAVSNRQSVEISVPPFIGDEPFYSVTMPLFACLFAVLLLGMIIGSIVTWFKQGSYRRELRAKRTELTNVSGELEAKKARILELEDAAASNANSSQAPSLTSQKVA